MLRTKVVTILMVLAFSVFAGAGSVVDDSTDRIKFLKFCNKLFDKGKNIDVPCRAFMKAMEELRLSDASIIAKAIHSWLYQSGIEMSDMGVPDLTNDEAEKQLLVAKETFVSAYVNKVGIVEGGKKLSRNLLAASEEMDGKAEKFQAQLFMGFLQLTSAGQKIGIDPRVITKMTKGE